MGTLQQQKEIWVLGSTGYVGAQLTKLLIQKRQEGVFPGRISTLGHRTILPWIMPVSYTHLTLPTNREV